MYISDKPTWTDSADEIAANCLPQRQAVAAIVINSAFSSLEYKLWLTMQLRFAYAAGIVAVEDSTLASWLLGLSLECGHLANDEMNRGICKVTSNPHAQ